MIDWWVSLPPDVQRSAIIGFSCGIGWVLGVHVLRAALCIGKLERRIRAIEDEAARRAALDRANATGRVVKLWKVDERYEMTDLEDEPPRRGIPVWRAWPTRAPR